VIQKAIDFALLIAKDDSHGYDQAHRQGKPDYDCSSLMIASWENAGVKVKDAGATYTGNMKKAFLKCGFEEVISKVNIKTGAGLTPGDVLLHEGKHTAMYIGDGQIVHAAINEKGKIVGGKSGDQTGKEIWVRSYYNHPWNVVLRYVEPKLTAQDIIQGNIDILHNTSPIVINDVAGALKEALINPWAFNALNNMVAYVKIKEGRK